MRNVRAICREYGQDLNWWDRLDTGMQALYMADLRLRMRGL